MSGSPLYTYCLHSFVSGVHHYAHCLQSFVFGSPHYTYTLHSFMSGGHHYAHCLHSLCLAVITMPTACIHSCLAVLTIQYTYCLLPAFIRVRRSSLCALPALVKGSAPLIEPVLFISVSHLVFQTFSTSSVLAILAILGGVDSRLHLGSLVEGDMGQGMATIFNDSSR